jgi:hypothetical protein
MADYRAESISDAKVAEDQTSVRVSFATGAEPVTLSMDWRLSSELIDKLAVVNSRIRHAISAPDTRAQRIRAGCNRTGIALGALSLLPALYGLWLWSAGALDSEGWKFVAVSLLAAPVVYAIAWAVGWVVAAFLGEKNKMPT